MLEFFRLFADRCHHAKEEDLPLVKMRERGMPTTGGPLAVMLQEHEVGHNHVRAIAEALPGAQTGNHAANRAAAAHLSAYAQMLRAHIDKEDNVLYPMVDRLFIAVDQEVLAAGFDRVQAEEIGSGVHERYHEMAHRLAEGEES
jgi:hemerythrin-like domain-containing protein